MDLERSITFLAQHQRIVVGTGRQREESLSPYELGEEAKADGHGGDGAGVGMKNNMGMAYTSGVIGKSELLP